jgi:hypothetical protein
MGSMGDAYDKAIAESFVATIECELIDRPTFRTKSDACSAVFTCVEGWYRPRRHPSPPGDISPLREKESTDTRTRRVRTAPKSYDSSLEIKHLKRRNWDSV